MSANQESLIFKIILISIVALTSTAANAGVVSIGPGAFPAGSTVLTFDGLPDGAEVNGLSVGGATFSYSLGNGIVGIDDGPGTTNNVAEPNIVSFGDSSGILAVTLPGLVNNFGFGYALLAGTPITNGTTVNVFNGATNVGSLSYNAVPDPTFAGGFAGIQSTIPFNSVSMSFDTATALAFAIDNVRFSSVLSSTVPEPTTMFFMLAGTAGMLWRKWK